MRHKGQHPDINVTPLVDVVLVLLIIFMVVIPQMDSGAAVNPPHAKNVDPEAEMQEPVVVSLTKHGEVFIDKNRVENLVGELSALRSARKDTRVQIRADYEAPYRLVRDVFRICQDVGFPGVGLQVAEKKDGEQKKDS